MTDWLANNGGKPVFGKNKWAPVRDIDGTKDFIQVGVNTLRLPGASHTKDFGIYPLWAETPGRKNIAVCTLPLNDDDADSDVEEPDTEKEEEADIEER